MKATDAYTGHGTATFNLLYHFSRNIPSCGHSRPQSGRSLCRHRQRQRAVGYHAGPRHLLEFAIFYFVALVFLVPGEALQPDGGCPLSPIPPHLSFASFVPSVQTEQVSSSLGEYPSQRVRSSTSLPYSFSSVPTHPGHRMMTHLSPWGTGFGSYDSGSFAASIRSIFLSK